MKITAVILLATCLQAAAAGYGQKVTISEKDAPVEKIFSLIRKQTGFQFLYANQVLAEARKVTIQVKNAELEDVLAATFQGQPFEYHIKDKTIIVRMRAAPASRSATAGTPLPPVDVRGRIVNASGEPVAGATISVEGTKKSTVTNANGEFTLTGVNENAILQISHVQYEGEAIVLNGRSTVNAMLQVKISSLDEMQVIAYGTTTKRLNTGNVATIKASDIEKQPVNNPLLALQGRVAGLFITQSSGLAGGGVTVRVQGQNSIAKGNDPLYVVDGVPYSSQMLSTTTGGPLGTSGGLVVNGAIAGSNPLSFINPSDIESIEVLKDADATAIYGSRAANGAILITSKKGKAGKTKIDFNYQTGWGKITRKLDLMNTEEYLEMRREAKVNDNTPISATDYDLNGLWDTTRYTDWQKELIGGTARLNNVDLSVSGGNTNTQFLVGGTYRKETTVFPGSFADEKGALHFNINNVSNDQKFNFQFSGNYMVDNNSLPTTEYTGISNQLAPNAPALYNDDGQLNWMQNATGTSTFNNPLARNYNVYKMKTTSLISRLAIGYQILPGLDVKTSLGYTNLQANETSTFPVIATRPENRNNVTRTARYTNSTINTWIIEPQIVYKKQISNARLEFLFGSTFQQDENKGQNLQAAGFNSDQALEDIKSATTITVSNSIASVYKYNAFFSRLNFNWAEKYILNLTARRDGSSRFGRENQFHNFGSIGGAWIFSQEGMMKDAFPVLSFGKLRASYGTTGNDQIGDYQFMNLFTPVTVGIQYQGATALAVNGLPNPFLEWEETKKLQVGIDLGFIRDRILFNGTYARNRSSNQLLFYALPVITGFGTIVQNFPATVENVNWEFSLNTINVKTAQVTWSSNINFTIPENKLVSFPDLETSTYSSSLIIGKPVSIIRAYQFLGVNATKGTYEFADLHGNATGTPSFSTDRTVYINTLPQYYGGFQNSVSYKGFQFDFLFQFVKQIGANSYFGNVFAPGTYNFNQPVSALDRWQKVGDDKPIQRYNANSVYNNQYLNATSSDAAYSDASFIRLKNASLSYQIPESWLKKAHLQKGRLYLLGQNLATITHYKGMDPENRSLSSLPPLRMFTAGISVGL